MIGIENKAFLLGKGEFFSFKAFMNETSFVITAPKVGSRFLLQVFEKNEVDFKLPSKIFSVSDLKVTSDRVVTTGEYDLDYDVEVYENSLIREWNKIIDGDSEKKLILLYRHPVQRFKSAIIQDFSSSLTENRYNNFFFLKELLLKGGFSEELTMSFLTEFAPILERRTGMTMDSDTTNYNLLYKDVEDLFRYLLMIYTKHASKHGTHHYSEYLSVIYKLIQLKILKNVTYINLDIKGDIENYFKDVLTNKATKPNAFSNNENGKHLLSDIIEDNTFIRDNIHQYLKEDLSIYSMLNTTIDGL